MCDIIVYFPQSQFCYLLLKSLSSPLLSPTPCYLLSLSNFHSFLNVSLPPLSHLSHLSPLPLPFSHPPLISCPFNPDARRMSSYPYMGNTIWLPSM